MDAVPLLPIKRVAIIGPECTGKSELSAYLAEHFKTSWVPEYARGYIDNLVRSYELHDLVTIAHGQIRLEDSYARTANKVLFCDTNLYVIKIWSEFVFHECPEEIIKNIASRHYDLYLLTYVDVPWEEDPQREHPQRREELYQIYLKEMKGQSVPFIEIHGVRELRQKTAVEAVTKLFVS